MLLNANFKFHPIGQGCFYSGYISLESRADLYFRFVYDCGTDSKMSYLEAEIDQFKDRLPRGELDLLIISHFDADHVNGISRLLKGTRCKRVIIPYYQPVERLLLYTTTTNKDGEYARFLRNPINFLSDREQFEVDEIIIIDGPDNDGETTNFPPGDIPPIDRISLEGALEGLGESEGLPFNADLEEFGGTNLLLSEIRASEPSDTDFSKVKLLQKPHKVDIGIWEFVFYLKKHGNVLLIKKFTEEADLLVSSGKLSIFDLFDEENIEELKKIYRSYYGQNLNSTSLVTFHWPLFDAKNRYHFYDWDESYRGCWHKNFGTLLTGDIDLNSKRKVDDMLQYFKAAIQEICVFQIPHHGSVHNWYDKPPNGLESFCNYLVNHGVGRAHHPSPDVIYYIKNHCNGAVHFNNEAKSFVYGLGIYY